ncbi:hypothetical protein KFK09_022869 [Dendrobium nobile]|uniref:Transposase MuDR plant domain-containing protein n=1 Tax=Dendrobium nobile TaxID=94219 RepID=A0A8T3AJJ0_DENNO|nr:hypothetical protein KFK09_022869 [Dendrobium nobile]
MVESSFDYNDCISSVPGLCYKDIAVGTYFSDAISFKHTLRSVAIKENFGVRIKLSDKKRVIATCSYQSCQWRIRASLCEDAQTFEVRRVDGVHTCPGINRAGNRLATSAWVAKEIQEMVKRNPDVPPKDINSNLEKEYGLSLPYMKLWRSREQARESIFGSVDDNYKWVPSLHVELIGRNPGLPCIHAIAFIGMKEHPLWHTYIHEYFYVHRMAYDGAIGMLPGKDQWQVIHDAVEIGAPNTSRPRGRPKRRRLPNFLEKDKKVHKCSRCNLWGHHRSTCKNPLHNNMEVNDTIITQVRQPKRPKLQSRRAVEELGDEYEYSNIEEKAWVSQISVSEKVQFMQNSVHRFRTRFTDFGARIRVSHNLVPEFGFHRFRCSTRFTDFPELLFK